MAAIAGPSQATLFGDDSPSSEAGWLQRIDHWCERFGDAVNPILVKETRQALKSRQFLVTFSLLLLASLGWTVAGSLMQMPQIYTTPGAAPLLIGYYVVLAVPMLLVVPLAGYRSLEGEIDDGTLELLSITALSPWQIVLGKLASASLQMLLYFVVLFPCVAYAYTLRGVDLPTTLLMMATLMASGLLLTVVALFFAPLAQSRTGRIVTLLLVMALLLLSQWGVGMLVIGMILYGNPLTATLTTYLVVFALLAALSAGHLLLTATAAQLTPESENRSTPMRLSLLWLTTILVGLVTFAIGAFEDNDESVGVFFLVACSLAALWTISGSLMAAESAAMTPRIRRDLPSSFLARCFLTFLTPGPATGVVFASTCSVVVAGLFALTIQYFARHPSTIRMPSSMADGLIAMSVLYTSYLVIFIVAVRLLVALIRINSNPRVEVGLAAMIAIAVLSPLVPYSVELHLSDYRSYPHSWWQLGNWAWTIREALNNRLGSAKTFTVVGGAVLAFLLNVAMLGRVVLPRRTATPERVQIERSRLA